MVTLESDKVFSLLLQSISFRGFNLNIRELLSWQVYRSLRLETFCPPSTRYSCVFSLRGQLSYGSRWRTWRGAMEEIWGHPTPWTITQSHFDSHHSVSIVDLFSIWYLATDTSWLSIPVLIPGCIGMLLKVG